MKLLRVIIPVVIVFIIASFNSHAEDYDYFNIKETFVKACLLYERAQFSDATKEYEKIIDHGYKSGNIYYNLGNAYFKMGSLGNAILNYERAKRLAPYDSDLKSNLEYAMSLTEKPAMDKTRIWLNQRIDSFLGLFSIDGLTILLFAIYILSTSLLIVSIFIKDMRKQIFYTVTILSILFFVILTLLSINIYRIEYGRRGIVVTRTAEARFEPRIDGVVHFTLYEGSNIYLIKTTGEWGKIKREDGKVGWLEASCYELI